MLTNTLTNAKLSDFRLLQSKWAGNSISNYQSKRISSRKVIKINLNQKKSPSFSSYRKKNPKIGINLQENLLTSLEKDWTLPWRDWKIALHKQLESKWSQDIKISFSF